MSSGNTSAQVQSYYVRAKGKILGPFGIDQLKSLRDRGRLSRVHEVSTDRRNWQPASRLEELFPGVHGNASLAPATATMSGDQAGQAAASAPQNLGPAEWYYSIDGQQRGPVALAELQAMASEFRLSADDLIWRNGMGDWEPAADIPGVFPSRAAPASLSASARRSGSAVVRKYQDTASGRLWDATLDGLRVQFPVRFLDSTMQAMITAGGFALMVAMLAGPGFGIYLGIKQDSLKTVLFSVLLFFQIAILKYVGEKMSRAAQDLVPTSPSRLSSAAYLRCTALISLGVGVTMATSFSIWAVQIDSPALFMLAAVSFAVFGYTASIALHPEWLAIECPATVTAGEEGVGILAFLGKLALRATGAVFGIGCVAGTVGLVLGVLIGLFRRGSLEMVDAIGVVTLSGITVEAAALFPIFAYGLVTIAYIALDVLRSIMLVPGKLDAMQAARPEPLNGEHG